MAAPTWAEAWTQFKALIKIFNEAEKYARVNGTNYLALEDTLIQALEMDGPELAQAQGALQLARSNLAGMFSQGTLQAAFAPHLVTLAKVILVPERDPQSIISRLRDYMKANSLSVNSRDIVRGAWTDGSPSVGTGTVHRLTVDKDNYALENSFIDVITATVVQDRQSGSDAGREVWEFRGRPRGSDVLELEYTARGSGISQRIAGKNADDSLLLNPTFASFGGTAALPTDVTSWTSSVAVIGDGTDYVFDAAVYYRAAASEGTTPYSLKVLLTRTLTQKLSLRRTVLDPDRPYFVSVAWNRDAGAATGTLTLRFGSQSVAVVLAAQAGWNILKLPIDYHLYPDQFNSDDIMVSLEWTRTGGTGLHLDEVLLVPWEPYDGTWVLPIGGATHFLLNDTGSFTDSASDAIIQRWIWRALGRSLPSATAAGETIADP